MVGTFKANNPLNTFLLFIYGLLLKFSFFSRLPVPVATKTDGILYKQLLLLLQKLSGGRLPVLYSLITYLLLFTQAILFNKILNSQRLIQRSTYLPAMSYLLITSILAGWNILSSSLIVNTLLVWVWAGINGLSNNLRPKTTLFNLGFMIGISSLIYLPSVAFALLIIFALILNRPFYITEWVITLAGILVPFYYLFVWLFLSDNFTLYKFPALTISYPVFNHNYWLPAAIVLVLIAFLTGVYFVRANIRKQVVQIRKSWNLLSFYLLLTLFIPFINDTNSFQYWIVAAIPLSAFIACAFLYPSKKWFPPLLHWSIAGFVIVISYYNK